MKRRIPFLLTFVVAPLFAAAARGETRPVHWTESAPPARVAACAVYDSASDRIVELGGSLGGASYRRSRLPAWECTLGGTGTWQRSALPSFANSSPASSALDPARREYWQFGVGLPHGFAARLGLAPGTGWSLVPLTTDVDTWDAMAFDVAHDRILGLAHLVGPGPDDTLALFSAPIAESLVFTRLPISGPQPTGIYGLTVVWDRAKAAFVVLAGGTLTAPIAGILILTTGEDRHWESVTPQPDPVAGSPSNLYAGLAAADPGSSDLYLVEYTHPFAPISFVLEGQLWKLEREPSPRWVRMPPPPVMAIRAALAVDTRRRRLVMLGGQDDALVVLPAVQWFDISTGQWTTSDAPLAPEARGHYVVAYDHPRDRVLIFGGYRATSYTWLNDLWARTSRDGRWHRVEVAGTPPPERVDATLVEDPGRDRMLLLGGWLGHPSSVEVWALEHPGSPEWAQLSPSGDAPDRVDGAVLDEARDRLVVHGAAAQPFSVGEWELTLGSTPHWRRLPVVGAAAPPQLCGFALDRARGRALSFGGYPSSLDRTISYDTVWGFRLDADSVRWERLSDRNERLASEFGAYFNRGSIVVDPVRDRLVSFGGYGAGGYGNPFLETRSSDIATAFPLSGPARWLDLDPVEGGPPPTSEKPIVYDPVRDAFLVFGPGDGASAAAMFELDGAHEGWPAVEPRVAASMHSAVRLEWSAPAGPARVAVMRRAEAGPWASVGDAVRDADGVLRFKDSDVAAGVSASYRLAWPLPGGDIPVGEIALRVGVPATAGLHLRGNPARGFLAMDLDLPRAGPVDVRLVDLAGRVVAERHIDVATAGRQPLEIVPSARVKPGLYFVRVTSPAGVATGRVTLLR
ncbi:MAG TPA: T9SS type A sorting domain-containing protein [Candidatus Eisenbacteria bacterium]|jgi:hypothetical protein